MKPALGALAALLAVISLAPAAFPQYMYLDTNGDGIHSAADVIAPAGVTTIDVWLRTDANRDGTPVTCAWGTYPMSFFSYEFALQVTAGAISWVGHTNQQPTMGFAFGPSQSTPTDFYMGQGGTTILPPGLYRLATVEVQVAAGAPSIRFVPYYATSGVLLTSFGSPCPGTEDYNTLQLGTDWFDTDGAGYGGTNTAPQLLQPLDIEVAEGSVAEQMVSASDPDGWNVTFSKSSGPDYMAVSTVNPGPGTGSGRIRLAPGYRDAGDAVGAVQASDGAATDVKSFAIRVTDVNAPPVLPIIRNVCIEQGQTHTVTVAGSDPDGDPVRITATGLPSFVTLADHGDGTATLTLSPGEAEPPSESTVTLVASDGRLTASRSFEILLREPWWCFSSVDFASGSPLPVARAGGPYRSFAGVPVSFDGRQSYDPGGAQLNYYWTFGDGTRGLGGRASHLYEHAGSYAVILRVATVYKSRADTTVAEIEEPLAAEALAPEGHSVIRLGSGKPSACVCLKPVGADFRSEEIALSTVEMLSSGTGSTASIPAIAGKQAHLTDWDGDGLAELEACFRMEDLRVLLGAVPNGTEIGVRIEGNLTTGGRFRAPFSARVLTGGPRMRVAVFPNPFNPTAVLRFETSRSGPATVRLYDTQGRLLRVLLDEPALAAGVHDVRIGAGSKEGGTLASGVYFYRVDAADGTHQGRLVVAK